MLHWDIVLIVDEAQNGQQQPHNSNSSALPRGTMYPSETVIHEQSGVGIYEREDRTQYQNGRLLLTSHRIVYKGEKGAVEGGSPSPTQQSNGLSNFYRNPFAPASASPTPTASTPTPPRIVADDDENAIFLPLSLISSATWARGFGSWSHPKITVLLTTHPSTASSGVSGGGGGGGGLYYKFSFRQGGIDAFFAHLERMLQSKVWERKIQQSLLPPVQEGQRAPATASNAYSNTSPQQVATPSIGSQNTVNSGKSTTVNGTFTSSGHGSAGAVGHVAATTTTTTVTNTKNTFSFPAATGASAASMVNNNNNNNNNNNRSNIAPAARNSSNSGSSSDVRGTVGYTTSTMTTTNVSSYSSSLPPSSTASPPNSSNGAVTATATTTSTTNSLLGFGNNKNENSNVNINNNNNNNNNNNKVDDDNNAYITTPLPRIGIARALRAREQRVEEAQAALAQHRQEALADADSLILNANKLINAIITLQNQAKQHRQQQGGEEEASSGNHPGQGNHSVVKKDNIISIDAALGDVRPTSSAHRASVGSSGATPHQGTPATFNRHSPSMRTPKGYNPLPLHESLAREILVWLGHPQNFLSRRFIIPLSELFSYYCKARSGDSGVSTGDFLEAIIALTAISVKRAALTTSRNSNQVAQIQMDFVSAQAPQRPSSALDQQTSHQNSQHQHVSFPMELVSDGKLFEGTVSLTEAFIKTVVSASASAPQRKEESIKAINAISSSRAYQQATSSAEEKKNALDRSIFKAMRNNDTMVKIVDSYLGGTVNSNINITSTSAGILNASRSLATFSLSKINTRDGGHEDRNSGWPLIACDDISLSTLATFAAQTKRPSKNKPLSSQDSTSAHRDEQRGSEFYELKRYKNGSICLQNPCISDRIVDLLKKTLFESAAILNGESADGIGSGGADSAPLTAAGSNYPNIEEDIPSITASEFGTMLGVHTDIAEEVLATLELAGVLCRDEHNTLAPTSSTAQKTERKNGSRSSYHHAAGVAGILSLGNGIVDDATLTALWTTPLFAETSSTSRKNGFKKANARWTWNWFFPEIFSA